MATQRCRSSLLQILHVSCNLLIQQLIQLVDSSIHSLIQALMKGFQRIAPGSATKSVGIQTADIESRPETWLQNPIGVVEAHIKLGLQNPMPQVAKSNRDGRSRHPFGVAEPNKDGKKLCKIRVAEPGMSCRTPFIELQNPIEVAEPNKDGRTPCHGVQGCGTRYKMKLAKAAIDLELPNPTRASKKGNPSTCAPSCRTRSG